MAAFPALADTSYTEVGDAGQTQAGAQVTSSSGGPGVALDSIFGTLAAANDADLFVINIFNTATFSATTVNATGGTLDTQIFLFTMSGAPVAFNDDASGFSLLSTLPAGGAYAPASTGLYILGVANAGYDPVNINNQLLFASGLTTDVRGPATGLQPAVLGGFYDDTFFASTGAYQIQLTGAGSAVSAVPEPASYVLFALAAAAQAASVLRRRRASR